MKQLTDIFRLFKIGRVLFQYGLDEWLPEHWLLRVYRRLIVRKLSDSEGSRGYRLRGALEELGPIYVKFGQMLSTRRDLLPDDVAAELVKLQDRVTPFSGEQAQAIVEASLNQPVSQVFASFSVTPLASASIAQVHPAVLTTGEDVVVKVLRPDIDKAIRQDISLLYRMASLLRRFWPEAARLHPVEVVTEFDKTLQGELDLIREGANATELRRNFEGSEVLYIPKIYWDLTREKVLVMERISGVPIGDSALLVEAGIDLKLLAERGVEIFFTQVFRDNFFHADMHPGNIFAAAPGRYIAVDFGIVGSLTVKDQRYLAENFLAFFHRDYRRVAVLHIQSGWVPGDTRIEEFEAAIRTVCEPIFEKPLGEISYGQLLLRLFQTARRFDMEVQPQLVLLQKTLLNIEGLGRELYPDLDLWKTAKPFLEKWYKQQMGPMAGFKRLQEELPEWLRLGPDLPGMVYRVLEDASNERLAVRMRSDDLARISDLIATGQKRTARLLVGGVLLILAAVASNSVDPLRQGYSQFILILGGLGGLLMLEALISGFFWRGAR